METDETKPLVEILKESLENYNKHLKEINKEYEAHHPDSQAEKVAIIRDMINTLYKCNFIIMLLKKYEDNNNK